MSFVSDEVNQKGQDRVRQEYKRYKQKKPPPDFKDVVDFTQPEKFIDKVKEIAISTNSFASLPLNCWNQCGLVHPSEWKLFELKSSPGLLFLQNPFKVGGQYYWSKQAITRYAKKPFPCNVDVHARLDPEKNYWEASLCSEDSEKFLEKLRWFHLGYHFDYNSVNYKQKKYFGFPNDLALLMRCIAVSLGFSTYVPETAIINYYPIGSSMGGHTDHYEEELDQPLISVSFGQSAVFLVGGPTRDIKPEAIWIHSGDVVIMSGPARVAFHAVPCILKNEAVEELLLEPFTCEYCNHSLTNSTKGGNKRVLSKVSVSQDNREGQSECHLGNPLKSSCELFDSTAHWEFNMVTGSFSDKVNQVNEDINKEIEHWCFCSCSSNLDFDVTKFKKYMSKTRININVRQVHCQPVKALDEFNIIA